MPADAVQSSPQPEARGEGANASGASTVRIPPGGRRELGLRNSALAFLVSRLVGADRSLNVFTTLGRHRRLFRAWMLFARQLLRRGTLAAADRELLILRVAQRCRCEYEWRQHVAIAEEAGLSDELIERLARGETDRFDRRRAVLLRAADELHDDRRIGDPTWADLAGFLSDVQRIELCMLVGHYEMLAMTLNSLGTEPEHLGAGR